MSINIMVKTFRVALTIVFVSVVPMHALAASSDEEVAVLKAQVAELSERLAQLESRQTVRQATYAEPKVTSAPAAPGWADKFKFKGDFRYRHEAFDVEDQRERHRQRIRARAELTAAVNEDITVGLAVATGSDDPLSANQTLDDANSSKNLALDQAYVKWRTPVENLSLSAGKFKNPFKLVGGNGLVWDSDLRPEGVALDYVAANGVFARGGGFWIDESGGDDDSFLVGLQGGLSFDVADGQLLTGASYFNVVDARGESVFFDDNSRGNLVNPDGTYVSGFEMLEAFAEYRQTLDIGDLTLFADYVHNLEADDFETGYAFGARLKQNKWQWGYTYQDLEADAVLGILTNSNFGGGGTDAEGHILTMGYALSKQIAFKSTLFLNDSNINVGSEREYRRLQLDISFKY